MPLVFALLTPLFKTTAYLLMNAQFDPFNNRLCRDIRNTLSEAFMKAIKHCSMNLVNLTATPFLNMGLSACNKEYVNNRLVGYRRVINTLDKTGQDDVLCVAALIWDQELFFEVHDYLEQYWMVASGNKKLVYQALIRAAGTYVHLEQLNFKGARGMADKAIKPLLQFREHIPPCINLDLLITKLQNLDPAPPKFHD